MYHVSINLLFLKNYVVGWRVNKVRLGKMFRQTLRKLMCPLEHGS
jgi:hypothetical protein